MKVIRNSMALTAITSSIVTVSGPFELRPSTQIDVMALNELSDSQTQVLQSAAFLKLAGRLLGADLDPDIVFDVVERDDPAELLTWLRVREISPTPEVVEALRSSSSLDSLREKVSDQASLHDSLREVIAAREHVLISDLQNSFAIDAEAAIDWALMREYAGLLNEFLTRHDPTFGGLEMLPPGRTVARVFVASSATPSLAKEAAEVLGLGGRIELTSVEVPEFELIEAINRFVAYRADHSIEAWVDIRHNNVVLQTTDRAAAERLIATLDDLYGIGKLFTIIVGQPGAPVTDARGGRASSTCTTGFNWNWNGSPRLSIAGHCGPNPGQATTQYVDGVLIPFTAEYFFGSYDIQFHTLNGLVQTPTIFLQSSNGQEVRTMTSRRGRSNQLVGDPVSKMGKTSGVTSGFITSKTSAPANIPNVNPTFMRAESMLQQSGDSGGPVFYGQAALGTVTNGGGIYMAIDYGESAGYSLVLGK